MDPSCLSKTVDSRSLVSGLRRLMRAMELYSRQLSGRCSLTLPQVLCLRVLLEPQPLGVGEVARRMSLSPSTLIPLLDRLEQRDLIRRTRHTGDRRRVMVVLSESGKTLLEQLPPLLPEVLDQAMDGLPSGRRTAVAESLDWLAGVMESVLEDVRESQTTAGCDDRSLTTGPPLI